MVSAKPMRIAYMMVIATMVPIILLIVTIPSASARKTTQDPIAKPRRWLLPRIVWWIQIANMAELAIILPQSRPQRPKDSAIVQLIIMDITAKRNVPVTMVGPARLYTRLECMNVSVPKNFMVLFVSCDGKGRLKKRIMEMP
jgi:hypothetical protein